MNIIEFRDEHILAAAVDRVSAVAAEGHVMGFSVDLRGGQNLFFSFPTDAKARTGHHCFVSLWKTALSNGQ